MDLDKNIQKELDKVVMLPKQEKKELKTYTDVLLYQLDEIVDRGQVGYTQEIILPVPEQQVKSQDKEAKKIIALAGRIGRSDVLEAKVEINTEEINGKKGKFNMINLSFKFEDIQQATAVREYVTGLLRQKAEN